MNALIFQAAYPIGHGVESTIVVHKNLTVVRLSLKYGIDPALGNASHSVNYRRTV